MEMVKLEKNNPFYQPSPETIQSIVGRGYKLVFPGIWKGECRGIRYFNSDDPYHQKRSEGDDGNRIDSVTVEGRKGRLLGWLIRNPESSHGIDSIFKSMGDENLLTPYRGKFVTLIDIRTELRVLNKNFIKYIGGLELRLSPNERSITHAGLYSGVK